MSTQLESKRLTPAEAARQNGRKSRGPVTPEGKAASSKNALKLGVYAAHSTLLANEDPAAFERLFAAYARRFRPADPFECSLVRQIVNTDWLISRYESMETCLLDAERAAQQAALELQHDLRSQAEITTIAADALLNRNRTLATVQRHIHNLTLTRTRLLKTLYDTRRQFPVHDPAPELDLTPEPPEAPETEAPSTERTQPRPAEPIDTPPEPSAHIQFPAEDTP